MSDTYLNTFAEGVASYLTTSIFPAIVQGLSTRGVNITTDELLAMVNIPAQRAYSAPPMAFNGAVPPMAPTIPPSTSNRKNDVVSNPTVGRCRYQYKRGSNKDMYCGKVTSSSESLYCSSCLKTRKGITNGMAAGAIPGIAPGTKTVPGMAGMPPGYSVSPPVSNNTNQSGQLSVVIYNESMGLYRDVHNNFIVSQLSEGRIVVLGRVTDPDNPESKIEPLSAQEQIIAQNLGLILHNAPSQTTSATPQAVPTIPTAAPAIPSAMPPAIPTAVPTIPSAMPPAIPTATPPAVPAVVPSIPTTLTGTGQPSLPVIAPLANNPTTSPSIGVPQIPSISN